MRLFSNGLNHSSIQEKTNLKKWNSEEPKSRPSFFKTYEASSEEIETQLLKQQVKRKLKEEKMKQEQAKKVAGIKINLLFFLMDFIFIVFYYNSFSLNYAFVCSFFTVAILSFLQGFSVGYQNLPILKGLKWAFCLFLLSFFFKRHYSLTPIFLITNLTLIISFVCGRICFYINQTQLPQKLRSKFSEPLDSLDESSTDLSDD